MLYVLNLSSWLNSQEEKSEILSDVFGKGTHKLGAKELLEIGKLMLELEVTVVKVEGRKQSYSTQSYGTYTENWGR